MKNKKMFLGTSLLIAVLMLGIGYAAINNIVLNINGTSAAQANQDNFKVKFSDDSIAVSDPLKVVASKTDDNNATISVSGLTAKGDTATATYTIKNVSPDLSASIAVPTITVSNEEYFKVTTDWTSAKVVAKDNSVTVTVTVELIKTPITEDPESTVTLTFDASPVQP